MIYPPNRTPTAPRLHNPPAPEREGVTAPASQPDAQPLIPKSLKKPPLRLPAVPVLRLPHLCELSAVVSLRLHVRPLPHRRVRRSLLLPLPLLRRHPRGVHAAVPARAALHLQGPQPHGRIRHADGAAARE